MVLALACQSFKSLPDVKSRVASVPTTLTCLVRAGRWASGGLCWKTHCHVFTQACLWGDSLKDSFRGFLPLNGTEVIVISHESERNRWKLSSDVQKASYYKLLSPYFKPWMPLQKTIRPNLMTFCLNDPLKSINQSTLQIFDIALMNLAMWLFFRQNLEKLWKRKNSLLYAITWLVWVMLKIWTVDWLILFEGSFMQNFIKFGLVVFCNCVLSLK